MPPSHHSSSSHSSHSSHSHHSSSHSHSSSRSYHSSSSHSSSYRSSAASTRNTRIITPIYRARSNQPLGYTGIKSPRVYRCKNHDYVHYDHPWTDDKTGVEYKAGFYDEEGTFYEDIVFSKQGEILDTTTAVCRCDYCRMEDSRRWADREKPCTHCGGTMSLVSQVDDLVDDTGNLEDLAKAVYEAEDKRWSTRVILFTIILIFLSPCILGIFGLVYEIIEAVVGTGVQQTANYLDSDSAYEYNIPNLGMNIYVKEEDGAYIIVDEAEYTANYRDGGYKHLHYDSDENYYDKETDMYVYLNEYIDPPQFQYWLEGLSSEYGDYGWMEYDTAEQRWYIQTDSDDWEPLSDEQYKEFKDRLWYIDYDFYK